MISSTVSIAAFSVSRIQCRIASREIIILQSLTRSSELVEPAEWQAARFASKMAQTLALYAKRAFSYLRGNATVRVSGYGMSYLECLAAYLFSSFVG
jgi:hypothetical protein